MRAVYAAAANTCTNAAGGGSTVAGAAAFNAVGVSVLRASSVRTVDAAMLREAARRAPIVTKHVVDRVATWVKLWYPLFGWPLRTAKQGHDQRAIGSNGCRRACGLSWQHHPLSRPQSWCWGVAYPVHHLSVRRRVQRGAWGAQGGAGECISSTYTYNRGV